MATYSGGGITQEFLDELKFKCDIVSIISSYIRLDKKGGKLINRTLYVKKNIFSSETLHFAIIDLMCSFIVGLGISLILLPLGFWRIVIGVTVGFVLFLYLMWVYFNTCINVYNCIEKRNDKEDNARRDAAFNKAFKKAWFLHFYYDAKKHLI